MISLTEITQIALDLLLDYPDVDFETGAEGLNPELDAIREEILASLRLYFPFEKEARLRKALSEAIHHRRKLIFLKKTQPEVKNAPSDDILPPAHRSTPGSGKARKGPGLGKLRRLRTIPQRRSHPWWVTRH